MRTLLLGILGVFVTLFFLWMAFLPEFRKEDPKGRKYHELTPQIATLHPGILDICLLFTDQEVTVYKGLSHYSGRGVEYAKVVLPIEAGRSSEALFSAAFQDELIFSDTLPRMNFDKRKALFSNAPKFEGRKYNSPEAVSDDWFERLDGSFLIFFVLSLFPFVILWVQNLLAKLIQLPRSSPRYFLLSLFFFLLVVGFYFTLLHPEWYSVSFITEFLLLVLIFVPTWLIFQFEQKRLAKWPKSNWVKEIYKFLLLLSLSILFIYVANWVCIQVDAYLFHSDGYTGLAIGTRVKVETGFAFSFGLGNLLYNLTQTFISLRRQNKKLKVSEGKALATEAELNAIQASVNPHFLYNSLNSIASLATLDPEKTEQMALALSKFYKYTTNRAGEHLIPLSEEVDMIKTYLEIEKIRFGDRLQYQLEIDPLADNEKIPHFLLQPLVENAVKYGYNASSEEIRIRLKVGYEKGETRICIYDQGKPFSMDLNSGYGLKSVHKKLELLFPDQHSLQFINEPEKHIALFLQTKNV